MPSIYFPPPDSTNTTSMKLLVFVTAALLASTSASPQGSWGGAAAFCECINPFQGTINAYRGDPDSLCGGPGFCYVACNDACRDQKQTASAAR